MSFAVKRVYEAPSQSDGYRVLVDRLWPRGMSKGKAAVDLWLKDVAPSAELRSWFDHRPDRFEEFKARYIHELSSNPAVADLKEISKKHQTVTLLYAAKDQVVNHAAVLLDVLKHSK